MADMIKKQKPSKAQAQPNGAGTKDQAPVTASTKASIGAIKNSLPMIILAGVLIAAAIAAAAALWPKISSRIAAKNGYFSAPPAANGSQASLRTIEEMEEARKSLGSQLAATIERVNEIEQELREVKNMIKAATPAADVLEANVALQQLKERFAKIEEASAGLDDLLARIGKLEADRKAADGAAAQSSALVLAVGQLREAARFDFPFAEPLAALKALAADKQELMDGVAALDSYAEKGVPSLALLRERFDAMAARAASAARFSNGSGLAHDVLARIASLFIIRQVDGKANPDSVDGILFNAETSLKAGDLTGAVKALEKLDGQAALAAEQWIKSARDRLAVEKALASINVFAVSTLDPAKK